MIGWLNFGSLLLGLIAWLVPAIQLMKATKPMKNNWFPIISFSACGAALFFQICTTYYRVLAEDWSALLDTVGSKVLAAAALLTVTIILNIAALKIHSGKQE